MNKDEKNKNISVNKKYRHKYAIVMLRENIKLKILQFMGKAQAPCAPLLNTSLGTTHQSGPNHSNCLSFKFFFWKLTVLRKFQKLTSTIKS